MSKKINFEFNDYIIAIDEPYENDYGYVAIGKKQSNGINIVFKSANEKTVNWFIELQKYISDLQSQLDKANERLGKLEDILEKYGFDVEKLNQMLEWLFTLSGQDADDMKFIARDRKLIHQQYCDIKTDRDTWKMACKDACKKINIVQIITNEEILKYEDNLEDYFYQQAKKEKK